MQKEASGTPLHIEEFSTPESIESLESIWNEILSGGGDAQTLGCTFDFFYSWWKYRRFESIPLILLIKEGEKIIGIAPLALSNIKSLFLQVRKVSFLMARYLGFDFIARSGRKEECIRIVLNHLFTKKICHYLEFSGLSSDSDTLQVLRNVSTEMGISFSSSIHSKGCYLPIEGTWESFLESKSRKFRKKDRQQCNNFEALGELEILRVRSSTNLSDIADQMISIDEGGWKAEWISRRENRGFLLELLKRCNDHGTLDLFILRVARDPVAYWFMIHQGKKVYALFTSYNEKFAHESPGFVCLHHALRNLFEDRERVGEVDFLSSYAYIQEWSGLMRERLLVTMYPRGLTGRSIHLLRMAIHRLRKLHL